MPELFVLRTVAFKYEHYGFQRAPYKTFGRAPTASIDFQVPKLERRNG